MYNSTQISSTTCNTTNSSKHLFSLPLTISSLNLTDLCCGGFNVNNFCDSSDSSSNDGLSNHDEQNINDGLSNHDEQNIKNNNSNDNINCEELQEKNFESSKACLFSAHDPCSRSIFEYINSREKVTFPEISDKNSFPSFGITEMQHHDSNTRKEDTLSTISKEWINGKDKPAQCGVEDTSIKKHPTGKDLNQLNLNNYNNNNCVNENDDSVECLPSVNMIMDVLEHMLTEVATASSSSSSSSCLSEPVPEPLDIVPESPQLIASSPLVMEAPEKSTVNDPKSPSIDDSSKDIDKCESKVSKDKPPISLPLICDKIVKKSDPNSDISTPSPTEEMTKAQLSTEQSKVPPLTPASPIMTSALSNMSSLTAVMSQHVSKMSGAASNTAKSEDVEVHKMEEKSPSPSVSPTTTVNACTDFFNALLKSDKTLTAVSNQGKNFTNIDISKIALAIPRIHTKRYYENIVDSYLSSGIDFLHGSIVSVT